jgi:uncharacterized protein (DUF1800 family)
MPKSFTALLLVCLALAGCATEGAPSPSAGASPAQLSQANLAFLNRVTWGADASSAVEFARVGRDRYLEHQLHPRLDDPLPPEVQAQVDAMTLSKTPVVTLALDVAAQQQALNALTDPDQRKTARQAYQQEINRLGREAATRSLLRDVYSQDQLLEQMTWFWMNHFNVHQSKNNISVLVGDYEDQAIRPHALGKFRDLLGASLHHAAMLRYLDNFQNASRRINENYARELMELHTLGVNSGYTQKDVQELARILTGVGVASPNPPKVRPQLQAQYVRDGLFEFNPNRHDYGAKVFLGHEIRGRGLAEVDEALDILARQPATARFISRKLAVYFVADDPSPALVSRMTDTFLRTDGDIASVLRTLFRSPEFQASLGTRFKDPVHYVISAVRVAYLDRAIVNAGPMIYWLNRLAEPLYGHETPDGYPLISAAWTGPGQMAARFEVARVIGSGAPALFKAEDASPPPPARPALPQLSDAAYVEGAVPMGAATRASLGQAATPQDWNTLFLSSPEFMRR